MIEFKISFTEEDLECFFADALEGGSTYWANKLKFKELNEEPKGRYFSEHLARGGSAELWTVDGEKVDITPDTIQKGFKAMFQDYPMHFADLVSGQYDAITADVLLQMICFGELVYG